MTMLESYIAELTKDRDKKSIPLRGESAENGGIGNRYIDINHTKSNIAGGNANGLKKSLPGSIIL